MECAYWQIVAKALGLQAYNAIVTLILEYGCPVGDPCLAKDIKSLRRFKMGDTIYFQFEKAMLVFQK